MDDGHGPVHIHAFPSGQGPLALNDAWIDLFWPFPTLPHFDGVIAARSMQNPSGRCPQKTKKAELLKALPVPTNRVADQCLRVLTFLRDARDLMSPLLGDQ
jgi:hypothetical protein